MLLCGLATVGCSRSVAGNAIAVDDSGGLSGPRVAVPLPQLLLDPSRFPAGYPATVLGPEAADAAVRDIDGVPAGATVTPAECAPPDPTETAVVASATEQGTLTVAVTRVDTSLQVRRDQLAECSTFTVQTPDASSTVSVEVLPAPPVADDALAVEQLHDGASQERALTLVAQHGDVRVLASMSVAEGADPDTVALDGVFTGAVAAVRGGARR